MPETRFVSAGKLTEKDLLGRETLLLSAMDELSEWLQKKACILADVPKGLPVRGIITSPFGARRGGGLHVGLDIAAVEGTPIFAPAEGVVVEAGPAGGYGNVIIIDHGGGFTTRYGHMSRIKVAKGDKVDAGDVIGSVGHVGWATGNHLHYEVRLNGVPLDPSRYIPKGLPVQLMDGSKSMFNEGEVGSAIEDMNGGIQMEGDQFVPTPLEGDSTSSSEVISEPSTEKETQPAPKPLAPENKEEGK